jgi:hypothetical protein
LPGKKEKPGLRVTVFSCGFQDLLKTIHVLPVPVKLFLHNLSYTNRNLSG